MIQMNFHHSHLWRFVVQFVFHFINYAVCHFCKYNKNHAIIIKNCAKNAFQVIDSCPYHSRLTILPDPVILSTAKDLDLPAPLVIPDLIGDLIVIPGPFCSHSEPFIVIPGLTRNLLPVISDPLVMPGSDRASPNP